MKKRLGLQIFLKLSRLEQNSIICYLSLAWLWAYGRVTKRNSFPSLQCLCVSCQTCAFYRLLVVCKISDVFHVIVPQPKINTNPTKGQVRSAMDSLYDILGWFSTATFALKILIQQENTDWYDKLHAWQMKTLISLQLIFLRFAHWITF